MRAREERSDAIPVPRGSSCLTVSARSPDSWVSKRRFVGSIGLPRFYRVAVRFDPSHSQWRDRAGFSPDFSFMPVMGS